MDEFLGEYRRPKVISRRPLPATPPPDLTHNPYMIRFKQPPCHCSLHVFDAKSDRYRLMKKKEQRQFGEVEQATRDMAQIWSGILDHPCDNDEIKMNECYKIDYTKRGHKLTGYLPLYAHEDSTVGTPVQARIIELYPAYRNPTYFKVTEIPRPKVDSPPPICWHATPATVYEFFNEPPNYSEYQDFCSKNALIYKHCRKQYLEPLPSTRRQRLDANQ